MNRQNRAFVVDHVCILPHGHNLNALVLFKQALSRRFETVGGLAANRLDASLEQAGEVDRILHCPYDDYVAIAAAAAGKSLLPQALDRRLRKMKRRLLSRVLGDCGFDYPRWRTRMNWAHVFHANAIGGDDLIFFPGADHHGCLALLEHMRTLPARMRPRVHVRLIGVMETAGTASAALADFLGPIRTAVADALRISLSAETPAYAAALAGQTGLPVAFLPHPLAQAYSAPAWGTRKTVTMPGQGRIDKGFFRLLPILSALRREGGERDFRFEMQDMRAADPAFRRDYRQALVAEPDVRLHPEQLAQAEIDATYRRADILVLPYDPRIYARRGSAVYQEGMACGRLSVCAAGTAFAGLVARYGNGRVASSDDDFARQIMALARLDRAAVVEMATAARERYAADFETGLSQAIGAGAQ